MSVSDTTPDVLLQQTAGVECQSPGLSWNQAGQEPLLGWGNHIGERPAYSDHAISTELIGKLDVCRIKYLVSNQAMTATVGEGAEPETGVAESGLG